MASGQWELSEADAGDLAIIRRVCLGLARAEEAELQGRPLFRVGSRRFAIFNGESSPPRPRWRAFGRSLHVLTDPGERDALRADTRFSASPHHGDRGWMAINLQDRLLDWAEISELLVIAHSQVAPRDRPDRAKRETHPRAVRPSARVVVVDDDGHVLLVRVVDHLDTKPPVWITPGGSVEAGESLTEAAARELMEETGLPVTPDELDGPLAVCRGDWEYRGRPISSEDWYFGLRTTRFEPNTEGYTDLEKDVHDVWRWWSPAELTHADEIILPAGLDDLVRHVRAGANDSGRPVTLPWTAI